ncbi:MAG: SGNH/GDSL hydrolase family protein [Anaerolineae bacterium]|nr:SGNH/GDSL hydrolase family protein [Anaerolineae bacterium]
MTGRSRHLTLLLLASCTLLFPGLVAAQNGPDPNTFTYEALDHTNSVDLLLARAQTIDLTAYPIIPALAPRVYDIFACGQQLGRDPHVMSKAGDCNSTEWMFLHAFGTAQYQLGEYGTLQSVVDQFAASFDYRTYAAHNGLNVLAVHDPLWAIATACEGGETPLQCEYRVHNPSVAVIMFGTNDLLVLTPEQFDRNLRRTIHETIQAGIIPVLSTFPRYIQHPEHTILFNQVVVRVALDFNVPLINLWLALEPLPGHGIDDDGFHLNGPITGAGDFISEANLHTGYPMRNLVTLQTLDVIWREVIQPHTAN